MALSSAPARSLLDEFLHRFAGKRLGSAACLAGGQRNEGV